MRWLRTILNIWEKPEAVKVPIPVRPVRNEMTLERWQTDGGLVNWAKQSQEYAYVLSVVQNQAPSGFPIRGQAVTDTQCLVELGRKEGYVDCQNVLLMLRRFPVKVAEEIPADYDNTDYDKASEG